MYVRNHSGAYDSYVAECVARQENKLTNKNKYMNQYWLCPICPSCGEALLARPHR